MRWIHVTADDTPGADWSASGSAQAPVLSLEHLDVNFSSRDGEIHAVRDLSLTIAPGECLGVVGESGAGKSQAFLAALGLLTANGRASGKAYFGSIDLLNLRPTQLDRIRGARIGVVFQDPMTSLTPHLRIGDQIAEPMIRHTGVSNREALRRSLILLNQVHVSDAVRRMRQYPHELSGGMRQRVMIAIALSCDPMLLIADEPTTALDVTIQAQILGLLADLKRSRGMSMALISHDMGAVAGVADRVAVMRGGTVVEEGTVRAVFKAPKHVYTRELLAAVTSLDGAEMAAGAAARDVTGVGVAAGAASRKVAGAGVAISTASRDVTVAAVPSVRSSVSTPPSSRAATLAVSPPALVLDDIRVQFKVRTSAFGPRHLLRAVDGVSLELSAGEALGVVGESGSGKSTLARAALLLIRVQAGRVVWLGRQVDALTQSAIKPLRRDIQVIFQDPLASLDPRMTAGETVAEPLRVHRPELDRIGRNAAVSRVLALVRLDAGLATRYPHELSGGQCQRVGIARAMVTQPQLLICDEPVSALDMTVQGQIVNLLAALKRESALAVLFISHNLAVVRQICDRIMVLYLGRMMELAPAELIYSQPLHPYTRELLNSAPIPDPDVQPARLARALVGESPSPLSPPTGCVYRTRCPRAIAVCAERIPAWERVDDAADATAKDASRWVACHRWREP
jgi:oligopeptide/dipeptide ABC transporter ATP-binding protein